MSDLIERLRADAAMNREIPVKTHLHVTAQIEAEAAEELSRLRARVAALEGEAARLREALIEVRAWRRAGVGLEPPPRTDAETLGERIDAALAPAPAEAAERQEDANDG